MSAGAGDPTARTLRRWRRAVNGPQAFARPRGCGGSPRLPRPADRPISARARHTAVRHRHTRCVVLLFELVIALLLAGALLSAWARRISVPYPALLALAGAGLALLPHAPRVMLDPDLALALFVAPVLLDAAFDSSPRDLKKYWRAVVGLAVALVAATIVAVAVVARLCVPGLPWSAAIALGAIVAPPDAAAATAVLKQMRPPHRVLVI